MVGAISTAGRRSKEQGRERVEAASDAGCREQQARSCYQGSGLIGLLPPLRDAGFSRACS